MLGWFIEYWWILLLALAFVLPRHGKPLLFPWVGTDTHPSLAYSIRRVGKGAFNMFFASLLLFTLVLYSPGSPGQKVEKFRRGEECPSVDCYPWIRGLVDDYPYLNESWPRSYFVWLFNPGRYYLLDPMQGIPVMHGIDLQIGPLHIRGSGALTGDLGGAFNKYANMPEGSPGDIGKGSLELFAFMGLAIASSMLCAAWRRRQQPRDHANTDDPDSHIQASSNSFYYPPAVLVGWYRGRLRSADTPTFHLY